MEDNNADAPVIMVIDDEPDLTALVEVWLYDDYRVRTASDGTEALERYTSEVDLVLLDRNMPDLNGYKVLEELRGSGTTCPVAMLTAAGPEQDLANIPFDDYLSKPVTEAEIRDVAGALLTGERI